jgi:hypothetical protein
MDRNPRLSVKCNDFINKKNKNQILLSLLLCTPYHIMNTFYHLRTQVMKPMLLGHVLDIEKAKQILEGLIVYQCTTFPQQIKQNNMDPFIFIFPNLSKSNQ